MIKASAKYFEKFDRVLFSAVLTVLFMGICFLYSASQNYVSQNIVFRQIIWILLGFSFLLVISRIDYKKLLDISYLLYGLNLLFLVIVLFAGETKGGAHRWVRLGAFSFQPSELMKITLVLALSAYIGRRKNDVTKISTVLGAFCFTLPAFILILVEPDLGTSLLLIPITLAILFIAGARVWHLAGVIFLGLSCVPFFWRFLLRDYQKMRLLVFLNPNIDPLGSGYTIIQSKIAIGSGGFWGNGWLSGTQNLLNFLPERHTDFIFSVTGEEWGFWGAMVLILLYFSIVQRGMKIVSGSPDIFDRLAATGFVTIFAIQVIINIGMTIGLFPIVGLTLPLISYGGSSLITTMIYMGLLLNLSARRPLF